MNWCPITKKPEEGRSAWLLTRDFNHKYPDSFEIIGGKIDHRDTGWWGLSGRPAMWVGPDANPENYLVIGWLYLEDFNPLPEWFTEAQEHRPDQIIPTPVDNPS